MQVCQLRVVHDLTHLKRNERYRPEHDPSDALAKRNRLGAEERFQDWPMMNHQLQSKAHGYNHEQPHVREQTHLHDGADLTAVAKGAQELSNHQRREGSISGLFQAAISVELVGKGDKSHTSGERTNQGDALEKSPVDQLRILASRRTREQDALLLFTVERACDALADGEAGDLRLSERALLRELEGLVERELGGR